MQSQRWLTVVDLGNRLLPAHKNQEEMMVFLKSKTKTEGHEKSKVRFKAAEKKNKTPESRGNIWMRKISKSLRSEDYKDSLSTGTGASR